MRPDERIHDMVGVRRHWNLPGLRTGEYYHEAPPETNQWYHPPMPQGGIRECMVAEAGHHKGHGVHGMTAGAQRKKRAQVRIACTHCQKACKKCSDQRPCERCVKYGLEDCIDSTRKPRKSGIKRGPYKRRQSKGVSHSIKDSYYDGITDASNHYDRMMETDYEREPAYGRGLHDAFMPPAQAGISNFTRTGWSEESPVSTVSPGQGQERKFTFPSINTLIASRNVTPQPPSSGYDVAPIHQVLPTFYNPLGQPGDGVPQAYSAPPSPRQAGHAFPEVSSAGPDWDDLRAALVRSSSAAPPDRSLNETFKPNNRLPVYHPFNRLRVATTANSSPLSSPAMIQSPTLFDQPMEMDLDEDVKFGLDGNTAPDVDMGTRVDRWPGEVGKTVRNILGM